VTWAGEALAAIRKIVLIEERIGGLTEQVKVLADSYVELDRRLLKMEAKFELLERLSGRPRKDLPAARPDRKQNPRGLNKKSVLAFAVHNKRLVNERKAVTEIAGWMGTCARAAGRDLQHRY